MPNNNYSVLATAQITLTDNTDASYLSGNLMVINSGRNQIYLTGQDGDSKYSPNWKTNNLVIRPFLTASQVTKGTSPNVYNPDIFDPEEYPNFNLRDNLKIINDIHWYIRDSAGVESEIYAGNSNFDFNWTYNIKGQNVMITDHRQLVIKNNILAANSSADIICKFSFYDPYAKLNIQQQYTITIMNVVAGEGSNKSYITAINGNSFYNNKPKYLQLKAGYYRNSSLVEETDLQKELEDATSNTSIKWFIRDMNETTYWKYLDPTTQDLNNSSTENNGKLYEVCHMDYNQTEEVQPTNNSKGGMILNVYPDLIDSSDVIKLVVTDNGSDFSDLIILYDNSDPTRATIYSTAGDKLVRSSSNTGTILKAVITHNGTLLDENNLDHLNMYNDEFDYYWYKTSEDGTRVWNIWESDENNVTTYHEQEITNRTNDIELQKSKRSIYISPDNVEKKNEFIVDIVSKSEVSASKARNTLLNNLLLSEEDLNNASIMNKNAGLNEHDLAETIATAYEVKAFSISNKNE